MFGNADWGLWQAVTQGVLSKSQFWFLMFPESKKKKEKVFLLITIVLELIKKKKLEKLMTKSSHKEK